MNVLILNHQHVECGVYQFGKRIYDIVADSSKINYSHIIVSNHIEYQQALETAKPDIIIYNWHWDRMPWLTDRDIIQNKKVKHYFIYHDGSIMRVYDKYLFFGDYQPYGRNVLQNKKVVLPRPLYPYTGNYPKNDTVTFGSFGFAFAHKGFPELVKLINNSFNKAVINIHMTLPYFGNTPGNKITDIIKQCKRNVTNKNITLNISTNFFNDDQQVLNFLAKNDINILNYYPLQNPGLSSAPDYLLSVKRPIAITKHQMLRHIHKKEILLQENTLVAILSRGIKPLEEFYCKWDIDLFKIAMDTVMEQA